MNKIKNFNLYSYIKYNERVSYTRCFNAIQEFLPHLNNDEVKEELNKKSELLLEQGIIRVESNPVHNKIFVFNH